MGKPAGVEVGMAAGRRPIATIVLALTLLATACGGGPGASTTADPRTTGVSNSESSATDQWSSTSTAQGAITNSKGRVIDSTQAVTDPSRAVADPTQAVTDPSRAIADPSGAVTDSTQAVTDPSGAVTTSTRAATTTGRASSAVPRKRTPRSVAYPTGGPAGPVFPPPGDPAYQWLAEGQCDRVLNAVKRWKINPDISRVDVLVYEGAASTCSSQRTNWDVAIRDRDELQRPTPKPELQNNDPVDCASDQECPRCLRIVFEWLVQVVDIYQSDPQSPPTFVKSSAPPLCRRDSTTTSSVVAPGPASASASASASTSSSSSSSTSSTSTTRTQ
jgi:hypothetical protein